MIAGSSMPDPKRPGRPPLDDHNPSVQVSFRLPTPDYDHLIQRASRERVTVADVIRRAVRDADRDDD